MPSICASTTPRYRVRGGLAGVRLDYNELNVVVGVEMLHLSKRSSNVNLSALQFETV